MHVSGFILNVLNVWITCGWHCFMIYIFFPFNIRLRRKCLNTWIRCRLYKSRFVCVIVFFLFCFNVSAFRYSSSYFALTIMYLWINGLQLILRECCLRFKSDTPEWYCKPGCQVLLWVSLGRKACFEALINAFIFWQVNSVKSIEKEVKVLKAKLSDEEVLDKSLEAKLVERQGKGSFTCLLFELSLFLAFSAI